MPPIWSISHKIPPSPPLQKEEESRVSSQESEKLNVASGRGVISALWKRAVRWDFAVLYTDVAMAVYVC